MRTRAAWPTLSHQSHQDGVGDPHDEERIDVETVAILLGWLVALGRAGTGVAFLAKPDAAARKWVGESLQATRYLVRAVGGRDVAIGVGIAWALLADSDPAAWILASVAADCFDAAAGAAMLDGRERTLTVTMAGGFAVLGVAAAAALFAT